MAKTLLKSAFSFTIFSIFISQCLILAIDGKQDVFGQRLSPTKHGLKKEKLTHFKVYWHDVVGGPKPTSVIVVNPPNSTLNGGFGFGSVTIEVVGRDFTTQSSCCFGSGGEPSYKKSLNHIKVSLSRGGTSHLRRHRENLVLLELQPRSGQTIIGRTENGVVYSFKFNKIIARRETVRYFVVEELPFVKVEKPTFHRWIKMAFGPQFKPPCRSTMRSDVMLSFQEERSALKDILRSVPGKVCLTSICGTPNRS
ncbi:hypothetical protein IFM89_015923 [Coptis chinensis]|uniref:Dirigent protein n=1 Tax=Coptis chinensis TaxID=261450 RepID=A0A835HW53_9MAGN|nr:hypothetical protein IFM89_015923 [Coptis chinensis]